MRHWPRRRGLNATVNSVAYQTSYGTVSSALAAFSAVALIMRGYTPGDVPFLTSHSSIADHAVCPVLSRNGFLALALDRTLATNGPAGTMNTSTLTAVLSPPLKTAAFQTAFPPGRTASNRVLPRGLT